MNKYVVIAIVCAASFASSLVFPSPLDRATCHSLNKSVSYYQSVELTDRAINKASAYIIDTNIDNPELIDDLIYTYNDHEIEYLSAEIEKICKNELPHYPIWKAAKIAIERINTDL